MSGAPMGRIRKLLISRARRTQPAQRYESSVSHNESPDQKRMAIAIAGERGAPILFGRNREAPEFPTTATTVNLFWGSLVGLASLWRRRDPLAAAASFGQKAAARRKLLEFCASNRCCAANLSNESKAAAAKTSTCLARPIVGFVIGREQNSAHWLAQLANKQTIRMQCRASIIGHF